MIRRQRRAETRPPQEGRAGRGLLEQPMHIGAENLSVGAHRTIGATIIQQQRRAIERNSCALAHVNLAPAHACPIEREASTHVVQLLFPMQHGVELEPAQSRALTWRALEPQGVGDPLAEHLQAAADADDLAAIAQMALEVLWPGDRKSTRLNSSHLVISYAVF